MQNRLYWLKLLVVTMAGYGLIVSEANASDYNMRAKLERKHRYSGLSYEVYDDLINDTNPNKEKAYNYYENNNYTNKRADTGAGRTIRRDSLIVPRQKMYSRYSSNQQYILRRAEQSATLFSFGDKNAYGKIDDSSIFAVKMPYRGHYKVGNPYEIMGKTYYPREDKHYSEIGVSSWYGEDFYGKKTANGEIYNMYDLTAAHRTLPLPSIVRVTNLENGKSIRLRVNDRGPFAKNRIIDVSKAAASQLGFHEQGTTRVKVEFLQKDTEKLLKMLNLK